MNFGFFRNYTKNIGKNLHNFIDNEDCVDSLLKYFCLLPQKESTVFQELVLNELLKAVSTNNLKGEVYAKIAEKLAISKK